MDTPLALIAAYYERFNEADWDGMCALLTDDVAHDLNQAGRETGRTSFRAFLDRMARSYHERINELVILAAADGLRAAAEYRVTGTYLATDPPLPEARGQAYALPGGAFFSIRQGRIARVTNWYNLAEWLRQIA